MRTLAPLLTAVLLLSPVAGQAQTLQDVATALGAANLKSIEIQGSGVTFQVGQSQAPGMPWPQFNAKSFARLVNYDTASLREEAVRIRALEPPRGGGAYVRGEQRQIFALSGDHAWNVVADAAVPAPITLADRQFQLWSTPHGIVKAALAGRGTMQGRTIAFAVPGRFKATATVDAANLIEKVDATLTNPVLGDMPVTVSYADYRDFGGVKFPTKIRQTYGGFPALDITVTDVRPNVAAEIQVPDNVRQAPNPYTRVTSQKVADGVFYITGGTHHSVAIEMQDHVIVVEAPLNDARALAVLAEVRNLIPNKPIRYVVVSHHHFDHSGGVRAVRGRGDHARDPRGQQGVLRARDHAAGHGEPGSPGEVGQEGDGGGRPRPARAQRRDADRRDPSHRGHPPRRRHADGVPAEGEAPDRGRRLHAAGAERRADDAAEPVHRQPRREHQKQELAVDQILPLHGRIVPVAELSRRRVTRTDR